MSFILVAVEGIIGAGKTHIMKCLQERHADWNVVFEPLSAWQDVTKDAQNNLLDMYYKEKSRWSLTLQVKLIIF